MTIQVGDASANPVFTDVVQQTQVLGALAATNSVQLRGQGCATVQVTSIGSLTLTFEGSTDGSNFDPVFAYPIAGGAAVSSTAANGHWININVTGLFIFRVRVSAYVSGSATVSVIASQAAPLPSYSPTGNQAVNLAQWSATNLGVPANFGTTPGAVIAGSVNASLFAGTTLVTSAIAGAPDVNIKGWGGTALGAPANFGTTPGAVIAESVNSSVFIGTTVAVASSAGVQKVGIAGGAAGAAIDGAIAAVPPANALQIGIKAATANPSNATAGNQTAIMGDKAGRVVVTAANVRELIAVQTTAISVSTVETTIITAGAAGVFNDLSALIVTTNNAAAGLVTIKDATGGTTRIVLDYPNAALAPSDAFMINFDPPIPQAAAANNWTATCSANAGAYHITAVFVKNL